MMRKGMTHRAMGWLLALALPLGPALADCAVEKAFTRPDEGGSRRVQVYAAPAEPGLGGARPLLFVSPLKVNTDGTRKSYNRHDPRAKTLAINDMRNAMRRGRTIAEFQAIAAANWQPLATTWAVLSDKVIEKNAQTGAPCEDAQGYLVSMTSDVAVAGGFNRVGDCRQDKWIDALAIPALVLPMPNGAPTQFTTAGAVSRSPVVAMTLNAAGNVALGLVGDAGPADELGEASVAMNRQLNGLAASDEPKHYQDAVARFQAPESVVMVFPGSGNRVARPITAASTQAQVAARFQAWGGKARLAQCVAAMRALP
jgi:hypothetical protein